jgi:hypothetical protein
MSQYLIQQETRTDAASFHSDLLMMMMVMMLMLLMMLSYLLMFELK